MELNGNNHGSAAVATATAAQPSFAAGASAATVGINSLGVNVSQLLPTMAAPARAGGVHVLPPDTPSPQSKPSKARRRSDSPPQDAHPRPCTAESVRDELLAIIAKMQVQLNNVTVDEMMFQTDVVKRLDESKSFVLKAAQAAVDQGIHGFEARVAAELMESARLTKHLVGHDAPVLQPLVEAMFEAHFALLSANVDNVNEWIRGRVAHDTKIDAYLEDLYAVRPQEGGQVQRAFQSVAEELKHLRGMSTSADGRGSAGATSAPETYGAHFDKLARDLDSMRSMQLDLDSKLAAQAARCHCLHVGINSGRIDIMQQELRDLQTSAGTSQAPIRAPPGSAAQQDSTCHPCDSADQDPWQRHLSSRVKSPGPCHCLHVDELTRKVDGFNDRVDKLEDEDAGSGYGDATIGAHFGTEPRRRTRRERPIELPLIVGSMGQLTKPEASLFDDKLANQASFGFDGQKGGAAWKCKVGNYFVSKCPAARSLLAWAEKFEGEEISEATLHEIATMPGTVMSPPLMDSLNGQIWGFLSNCVAAEADTVFKGALDLQGFDAWRRILRYISHGHGIQLEQMRTDMKTVHLRPIKNLESVAIGIAEFELRLKEYGELGGTLPDEQEKKTDLLNILPAALRENLLWRATDPGPYIRFRDMVRSQAARSLMMQRRLPLHKIEEQRHDLSPEPEEEEKGFDNMNREELLAFVRKNGSGQQRGRERDRGGGPRRERSDAPAREPRKCPNCGQTHKELKCPLPPVDRANRPCWVCNKTGHIGRDCPSKKQIGGVTDDRQADSVNPTGGLRRLAMVEYAAPKKAVKPRPRPAVLSDFLSQNSFGALSQADRKAARKAMPVNDASGVCGALAARTDEAIPAETPAVAALQRDEILINKQQLRDFNVAISGLCCKVATAKIDDEDGVLNAPINKPHAEWLLRTSTDGENQINMLEWRDIPNKLMSVTPSEVTITVAADSGAVDNVIHPDDLPAGCVLSGANGEHFIGASGEHIERFGEVDTVITGSSGKVSCSWQCADVTRALHSISKVTGPEQGPGVHEVLFTNKRAVVVPAGFVEEILKRVAPIFEYQRRGNLYLAEVKLSSFARPVPAE